MTILQINSETPQKRFVQKAAEILDDGGVILYPTDTVYAFGCDIEKRDAIEKIYRIRHLEHTKLLSFIFSDISQISAYVRNMSDTAYKVLKRTLPGPYTYVFEASKLVPKFALTKQKTVGVRIPDHPVCRDIVRYMGRPVISATALTQSGELIVEPGDIERVYLNQLDLVLDCGRIRPEPSTVIDFTSGQGVVLREGKGPVVLR